MTEHLLPADLDRLVSGKLAAREKRRLLAHLAHGCSHCCGAVARFGGIDVPAGGGEEYDDAVDRGIARALRVTAPGREARATLAALLAGERPRTPPSGAELATLRGLPRVRALLEACNAFRHQDPQAMLRFAKLARCAADRLRTREIGREEVADLRALVWAELATAYRIRNELELADQAMNRALYWCRRGSRSEALLARVAHLLAALLGFRRRFPEGIELLGIVHRIYLEAGNRHLAGQALISQANLTSWNGDHRQALSITLRAIELVDPDRDPQLLARTVWNLIWLLAEIGHFRAARRLLWRGRTAFSEVFEPHRLRWLDARIYSGLGDFPRAEAAFQQARAGFVEHEQIYPAALVGLDLAALLVRQGRLEEVFALAEEMIVAFRALRVAREAAAALVVLKRACAQGSTQLLGVIDIAQGLLRDLERQPARPRGQ
jgi:tetratricopeptide (TPR) repeat protein